MRNKWVLFGVVASLLVLTASVALAADGSVLANAIAKQVETAPNTLNMQAEPGYLGIPGGPKVNMQFNGVIPGAYGAFGRSYKRFCKAGNVCRREFCRFLMARRIGQGGGGAYFPPAISGHGCGFQESTPPQSPADGQNQ